MTLSVVAAQRCFDLVTTDAEMPGLGVNSVRTAAIPDAMPTSTGTVRQGRSRYAMARKWVTSKTLNNCVFAEKSKTVRDELIATKEKTMKKGTNASRNAE